MLYTISGCYSSISSQLQYFLVILIFMHNLRWLRQLKNFLVLFGLLTVDSFARSKFWIILKLNAWANIWKAVLALHILILRSDSYILVIA